MKSRNLPLPPRPRSLWPSHPSSDAKTLGRPRRMFSSPASVPTEGFHPKYGTGGITVQAGAVRGCLPQALVHGAQGQSLSPFSTLKQPSSRTLITL